MQRVPAADVGPAHCHWGDGDAFCLFHHGIIDTVGRRCGKGVIIGKDLRAISDCGGHGGLSGGEHLGSIDRKRTKIHISTEQENAPVPHMVTAGDHFGGARGVRFFDKAGDLRNALA